MIVTKKMHHIDLQGNYDIMKFSSKLLMNNFGIRLLNANTKRSNGKNIEGLHCEETYIPSRNGGPDIRLRIFKPLNHTGPLPGMLYIHGGGYMLGSPEEFMTVIQKFIDTNPCVVVAPDYRKAVTAPFPAAFNDCYDSLLWLNEHVDQFNIIPHKIIVAGHSSGGGLTAAVTLKATDTNQVKIAFQMPVYPMLDDRQDTPSAKDNNSAGWNAKSNKLGWSKYLGDLQEIPPYAAPARAEDFSKLPPTITFVGDLEPFRDETIMYVQSLEKNGIPVAFKLYPGCYHAFEILFPQLDISKDAWQFLLSSYNNYVERYIYNKV